MESPLFRIIALRVNSDDSAGRKKLIHNKYYYFYEGYRIENNTLETIPSHLPLTELYNNYFKSHEAPHISISAIVGENGSGKSSIVEFMIRLINNFAASTIGEYTVSPSSQHLQFINGISGELIYIKENNYYRLIVEHREIKLIQYIKSERTKYIENTKPLFSNQSIETPFRVYRDKEMDLKTLYNNLFYTFVSNFSIYAYNTQDFEKECITNEYKRLIKGTKNVNYPIHERNWLSGIFHKNDGYQTPIVLTPFREKGNIYINTENTLAKERLITLMLMSDSKSQNNFRLINGHLEAINFKLAIKRRQYDRAFLKEKIGFKRLQNQGYANLEENIIKLWSKILKIDLKQYKDKRKYYRQAVGYLTYKTLKISKNYIQYNKFIRTHIGIHHKIDQLQLEELILKLSGDFSHITQKIRQVLSYILFNIYDQINDNSIGINYVAEQVNKKILIENQETSSGWTWRIQDFVPCPIFNTEIHLIEKNKETEVLFSSLSSGEKQIAYSISSLLYHLLNIDSVSYDKNKNRIDYQAVNIILEEIELYFHPDLQKKLIKYILDGLTQVCFSNIKSLNICIVTHSPFILSDIPTRNILFLNKDAEPKDNNLHRFFKSFGANIHDMLKSSFFLSEGAIGEYAQELLNEIIIVLDILNSLKEQSQKLDNLIKSNKFLDKYIQNGMFNIETFKQKYNSDYLHKLIMLFDEPILRIALLEEFDKYFEPDKKRKEMRIEELERELKELKYQ